jgi:hypothetical protein
MAAWMLYAVLVGALLATAAAAVERMVGALGLPSRFIWVIAMLLSLAAVGSVLAVQTRDKIGAGAAPVAFREPAWVMGELVSPHQVVSHGRSWWTGDRLRLGFDDIAATLAIWNRPLLAAWALSTLAGIVLLAGGVAHLAFARRRWQAVELDGVPVRISRDVGPAVVGVFQPCIVLPRWVEALPAEDRELVLLHELEHARARDPALLQLGLLLLTLMPWNPASWSLYRGLRAAIELDCDGRVLRQRSDPHRYGALLLNIGERTLAGLTPRIALAESDSLLRRRIAALLAAGAPRRSWRSSVAGTLGLALAVLACRLPAPSALASSAGQSARTEAPAVESHPAAAASSFAPAAPSLVRVGIETRAARVPAAASATDRMDPHSMHERIFTVVRRTYPELASGERRDLVLALLLGADGEIVRHRVVPLGELPRIAGVALPGTKIGLSIDVRASIAALFPDVPAGELRQTGGMQLRPDSTDVRAAPLHVLSAMLRQP